MVSVIPPEGFINLRQLSSDGHKKMVYVAFHTLTRSWKVLKEFRETPTEETVAEDLRPLLSRLEHENIIRIDPPQVIGGHVWIIEEQLDGTFQDLAPLNDRYTFSLLASHIASGLKYVHNFEPKAIVHGDIHLRNCGVINGVGKLLDFGQATYDDPTHPRSGPRGYICTRSPEQFSDSPPPATTGMDIWALGCTLYALRAGEYPFITAEELNDYRSAKARSDMSAILLEGVVGERTGLGLDSDMPRRYRSLFDSEIWAALSKCVQAPVQSRLRADDLAQELKRYVASSESLLKEAEIDPGTMLNQARAMLDEGQVTRLPWFEEKVREAESERQSS